ncbi:MAG: alpha/beta fold hydrolase [Pseudomonadota bacterium]
MFSRTERVEFTSAAGAIPLVGEIDWPAQRKPQVPAVIFSHGWGSGKASPRNRIIAGALAEAGIAAFRIDFTGHGESGGSEIQSTLGQQVADLSAAVDHLATHFGLTCLGLAGSSSGGLAALRVASREPRLAALVLREPRSEGMEAEASRITAPTLLIQGGEASPLHAAIRRLAAIMTCPHRLLVIEGGGHLFEAPGTFDIVSEETVRWFRTHLPLASP